MQVFKRNLIEVAQVVDADGNNKNDRYRASRMKMNEEHTTTCALDIRQLVDRLYAKYRGEITAEEIEYYRKHLKPSRLQQMMIEIYFFNYTSSSSEFSLTRDVDWYKLLLIMRHDLMHRLNVNRHTLLDSTLILMLTANIEETPVGEKMYVKDMKYLKDDPTYQLLAENYYSTLLARDEEAIKKFLITFANSKYRFVLYEEPAVLDQEISINKREMIHEMLDFLLVSNTAISLENLTTD